MALTKQQIIDKAWHHFLTEQHAAGLSGHGGCSYAGECALGICMPPDMRQEFDLGEVQPDDLPDLAPEIFPPFPWFLSSLQSAHDRAALLYDPSDKPGPVEPTPIFHSKLAANLVALAIEHGLTVPHA